MKLSYENVDLTKIHSTKRELVVDDNLINRMAIKKLIKRLGIKIDLVKDGLSVLKKIKKKKYDILLIDFKMPIMNRYELQ